MASTRADRTRFLSSTATTISPRDGLRISEKRIQAGLERPNAVANMPTPREARNQTEIASMVADPMSQSDRRANVASPQYGNIRNQ
ncbi:hypothetical protein Rmet_5766 (plasmid) [Cupriavidus metallidurans CH34]|uniref:Uncharacterized protein n=1 Tax=Cupriavidus metallidurans (strain ATCC 43123 / DSM 2839 / NBRC 102507 / CH34) TaxID=266264 RepID=Q1LB51_CUPMC|nr:hypothetical protein Rmet_5766 [Cupriavidus metallidurans CH34]